MSVIIKTENLSHVYSVKTPFEKTAVDNVSIEIKQGEFIGVIGHTGSGKSTLIQHFNGLLKPTSGKIYVDSKDIWEDKENIKNVRFDVGLVFQYPEHQLFEATVFDDIAFGPKNMGLSKDEIEQRVCQAAEFAGVKEELLYKSPFELSGGQKRRAAIAGVIAMEPKVLILDEPTAGLDPKGRESILRRISDYHKSVGNTVLLVSHSMEDIARFSDRVLVMNGGKVWDFDTPENVFSKTRELMSIGLSAPQISGLFDMLASRGVSLPKGIFTVEQAKDVLLAVLREQNPKKGGGPVD